MRAGRMTEGQQRGLDQGAPLYVLPLADAPVDYDQVFGRSAPRTLEIGFGMGHSLLEMAAASPEQDFIGVEVHRPGVGALLNGVLTQGLTNLRVYDCDAIEVLTRCVADGLRGHAVHAVLQSPVDDVCPMPKPISRVRGAERPNTWS